MRKMPRNLRTHRKLKGKSPERAQNGTKVYELVPLHVGGSGVCVMAANMTLHANDGVTTWAAPGFIGLAK